MTLYLDRHEVEVAGRKLLLTKKEFELLTYLLRNKNIVLTREKILEEVWGYDYAGDTNVVDVYIRYIRGKIGQTDSKKYIHTVRGVGYVAKRLKKKYTGCRCSPCRSLPKWCSSIRLSSLSSCSSFRSSPSRVCILSWGVPLNGIYTPVPSRLWNISIRAGQIDSSVFTRSNLQPFVNLQVYDAAGRLILDNGPAHTIKNLSDRYIDDTVRSNGRNSPSRVHPGK
jgi:hypothetical protein